MQSSSMPCGFTIPSFRGCTRGLSEKPIVSLSAMIHLPPPRLAVSREMWKSRTQLPVVISFNDLIGPQQQQRRDRQTERLRRLRVDDQLEPRRLLDWKFSGIGALRDKDSGFRELAQIVDRELTMLERERCELLRVDKP